MTSNEVLFEQGLGALNALRLLAHNLRLENTEFAASTKGHGPTLCETIQYRARQSWGNLTRSRDKITIRVIANTSLASNFVSRTLAFHRSEFKTSWLFRASNEEVMAESGRSYAMKFAQIFDVHQTNSKLYTFEHDGETYFTVQADDAGASIPLIHDLEQIALGLDVHMRGQGHTLTSHPAFDMAGNVTIIDNNDQILKPTNAVLDRINQMDKAAKLLPPTFLMVRTSSEYPMTFRVLPYSFSLETPKEPHFARTRALGAAARLSVQQGADEITGRFTTTIYIPSNKIPNSAGDDRAIAEAIAHFNRDWDSLMLGDPKPEILTSSVVHQTVFKNITEVEIVVRAETDAARRYNESGRYELRPQ